MSATIELLLLSAKLKSYHAAKHFKDKWELVKTSAGVNKISKHNVNMRCCFGWIS